MSDPILHSTIQPKPRMLIRWWLVGVLGGVVNLVWIYALLNGMEYFEDSGMADVSIGDGFITDVIYLTIAYTPTILNIILFALWGSQRYHYFKTVAVAVMSITPAAIFIYWLIKTFAMILGFGGWGWDDLGDMLKYLCLVYFFTILGATIIWLIFGRIRKDRNQIMRD